MFKKGMAFFCIFALFVQATVIADSETDPSVIASGMEQNAVEEITYSDYSKQYPADNYLTGQALKYGVELAADIQREPFENGVYGRDGVFHWTKDTAHISWEVQIPQDGLYAIALEYCIPEETLLGCKRKVYIDGKVPFEECISVSFPKLWMGDAAPLTDINGDDVMPEQRALPKWDVGYIYDADAKTPLPLSFFFPEGTHTITFEYADQDMYLSGLTVKPVERIPDYAEVEAGYVDMGYKIVDIPLTFEAESQISQKNDMVIQLGANQSSYTQPFDKQKKRLNYIGGGSWQEPNQTVTWSFTIKTPGLYKIGMNVLQNAQKGLPVYRQVRVDGVVPFKEFESYCFAYHKRWHYEELADSNGTPYYVFLDAGSHTISLTAVMGERGEIYQSLYQSTERLSELIRRIVMITGSDPDPNYDYEIEKNIPGIAEDFWSLSKEYDLANARLLEISSVRSALSNQIHSVCEQLEKLAENPDYIAKRLNDLNNMVITASDFEISITDLSLGVDAIQVGGGKEDHLNRKGSFWESIEVAFFSFIHSFLKDYDAASVVENENITITDNIDVWISRGKEWGEQLKSLADSDFTSSTGINVSVNVLPSDQLSSGSMNLLMLAMAAGTQPDVAIGVTASSPVEFAIRNQLADLSAFPETDSVQSRFLQEMLIPYQYKGGLYALPDNIEFRILFYRKDILEDLGIEVPETWDDVYGKVLPVLSQNSLQMYIPAWNDLFIYQNNGKMYNEDGTASALDSEEAFQGMKQMIELYTNYGIPVNLNFFNRFRTGECPIGIGSFATYIQFVSAAPDIDGKWGVALIPGQRDENGNINRTTGTASSLSIVIPSQSQKQAQAWSFVEWWTRAETQKKYGMYIESRIGTSARWNTANVEAFAALPWRAEDLETILDSFQYIKETPVVLGGYYTARHISNAWNRCIINHTPVRESLRQCVEDINKELERKQKQYAD